MSFRGFVGGVQISNKRNFDNQNVGTGLGLYIHDGDELHDGNERHGCIFILSTFSRFIFITLQRRMKLPIYSEARIPRV